MKQIAGIAAVFLVLIAGSNTFAQDDYSVTPEDLSGIVIPLDGSNMPNALIPVPPPDPPPPTDPPTPIFFDSQSLLTTPDYPGSASGAFTVSATSVPEPSSTLLIASALLGLAMGRFCRRRR